ncbi:MAG: PD-(D/E)XK nuclease family protein [Bacteroidales bacterium]|nr:PD-(D/E)XK nuclease family protein [Bacteroidales bacterium]
MKKLAEYTYSNYANNLSNVCLIFPNRRAGLFFNKYLAELISKPVFAPEAITINDLMHQLSDYEQADELFLINQLFKIYSTKTGSNESLDDFFNWGEMLLADFSDIDKYLVDAGQIFQNLKSVKDFEKQFDFLSSEQIELIKTFWESFSIEKYGNAQNYFISLWEVLFDIYSEFRKVLAEKLLGYEGMIYRNVAEKNLNLNQELKEKIFLIAGFNAINSCEERLFLSLKKDFNAKFFWDYDSWFMKDNFHEAGYFMRKNLKLFPETDIGIEKSYFESYSKNINVISSPNNISQATALSDLLSEIPINETEQTAVVLCDEHLLLPAISNIPKKLDFFNVTMGFPASQTSIALLIDSLIKLQKNFREKSGFYYKDVISIINHPYTSLFSNYSFQDAEKESVIEKRLYFSQDYFNNHPFFEKINESKNAESISNYFTKLLKELILRLPNINIASKIEREFVFSFYTQFNRLNELIIENKSDFEISDKIYLKLLSKITRKLRVPFSGEPLKGMQLMGILETRLLDFKNVIILSVNEGTMPVTGSYHSFIPYSLRKAFGMPAIEEMDAIYAYYFYRFIQRAENITLFYSNGSDGKNKAEMSRYLYQLIYDSPQKINIKNSVYNLKGNKTSEICIEKTPEIYNKISKYLAGSENQKVFSPSGLNTYLDCRLKFYFRYIAGIKEKQEPAEEVDFAEFGSILHDTMKELYSPFLNKTTNAELLKNLLLDKDLINNTIISSLNYIFLNPGKREITELSSRNKLIVSVLKKYISKIIELDIKLCPFEIKGVEKPYQKHLQTKTKVIIGGTIDRIDQKASVTRVIDYKTGGDANTFPDIESLFAREEKRNKAVFQTFLYAEMVLENEKTDFLQPAIFRVKDVYSENFSNFIQIGSNKQKTEISDYKPYRESFIQKLDELIDEIFDTEIPFDQVSMEMDICKYCPYKTICGR